MYVMQISLVSAPTILPDAGEGRGGGVARRTSRQRLFERGERDDREHVSDRLDDEPCGDRRTVVMQDRHQPRRVDVAFADQQRAQLRVAVLLDDKNALMRRDEIKNVVMKRVGADAHRVEVDAALL